MRKNLYVEQFLYAEWKQARERAMDYEKTAITLVAESGNPESAKYHERLAELEWAHSVDILEIIYDFEKERAS